jgi:hypothetical protein
MAKRDFLTEQHTVTNFAPFGNDVAKFDARLNVRAGTLDVDVRIKFSIGRTYLGTTGLSGDAFRSMFDDQLARYWDGRYDLNVKASWDPKTYTVTPRIRWHQVGSNDNAHFVVDVKRLHLGRSVVTASTRPADPNTCVLYSDAVRNRPSGFLTKLGWKTTLGGSREELLVGQARKDLTQAEKKIVFDPDERTGAFGFDENVRWNQLILDGIVTTFNADRHTRPSLTIEAVGFRMPNETGWNALQRAGKIQAALEARGFPRDCITAIDGGVVPTGEAKPFVQTRVREQDLVEYLNAPDDFPIAAHEFGHMLGNLDEYPVDYDGNPNSLQTGSGPQMAQRARELGVPIPPFSANTTSLMSLGDRVLPFHYLPFVGTLDHMHLTWLAATHEPDGVGPGGAIRYKAKRGVETPGHDVAITLDTRPRVAVPSV